MSSKQTAVEWLKNTLLDLSHPKHRPLLYPLFEHAKAKEKEQIMDAYENGENRSAELYYNETYGK